MPSISNEDLKRNVSYDPETGIFIRLIPSSNAKAGDRADTFERPNYYKKVQIMSQKFKAHRLAIQYMTGSPPLNIVDHINGDRSDNRYCNLRQCDIFGNAKNAKRNARNTSGYKGVSWHRGIGRWTARIMVNKIPLNLGVFNTAEDAYRAYCEAAILHHGEFARLA